MLVLDSDSSGGFKPNVGDSDLTGCCDQDEIVGPCKKLMW